MKLGYTGPALPFGMTEAQRDVLAVILTRLHPDELHHGDCDGGDEQAHRLVRQLVPGCHIVGHSPADNSRRAYCEVDELRPAEPFLVRDEHIAAEVDVLIATPAQTREVRRSGVWATIRYARTAGTPALRIDPDGTLHDEDEERLPWRP
jgi:hypothetical protein